MVSGLFSHQLIVLVHEFGVGLLTWLLKEPAIPSGKPGCAKNHPIF